MTLFDIDEILALPKALWRRKLWVILATVLGVGGGVGAGLVLPERYETGTLILVEAQKVPESYVRSTVTTTVPERLRTIRQQITNRESLERIIEEVGLYREQWGRVPMEQLVARARNNLGVRVQNRDAFRINFRGSDPQTIARAANRIAESFIQENLKVRESQAKRTSEFLQTELETVRGQLEEKEALMAQFRIAHEGELPEQRASNLTAIAQLQGRIERNRAQREEAEIQRFLLDRESRLRPVASGGAPIPARPANQRLTELRLQLAELRSSYTDRHPDVVRLRRQIADLEGGAAELEESAGVSQEPEVIEESIPEEPQLAVELLALERRLERLDDEYEELQAKISFYQRRLERTPQVEQDLLKLTRDYNSISNAHGILLAKLRDARLAERLEETQQSEQFRILERAMPPGRPASPNRKMLLTLGLVAGLALGAGGALLHENIDQTFGDPEALGRAFPGVPLLATIPHISPTPARLSESGEAEKKTA